MSAPTVVVVGTGPAGVRAAQALVEAGLRPILIDEGLRDGGQIYRRQPEGFKRDYAVLYGSEASKAYGLHQTFEALRQHVDYRSETLAWNITQGHLHTVQSSQAHSEEIAFDALIICSGATDRLMPVQGWNLAGCFSLGAAQIALKAQACSIGSRVVFLGSGPLLYLVASQYVKAGAKVVAVLDTAPLIPPLAALRGLLSRPLLLWRGLQMMVQLKLAGVALLKGVKPLRIEGLPDQGVSGIVVSDSAGRERQFSTDAVGMGWHLRAESQLADLAACEFSFEPMSRQWLPRIDQDGRSSQAGVYLAGDGARILGADGAEAAGRLAALAAMSDLQQSTGRAQYQLERDRLRQQLAQMDQFRRGLAQAFPWPYQHAEALPDEAVVCRCEAISAGELRRCVQELGSRELNHVKAFSRVGMGRCQGRYCGHAAAEVIAAVAHIPVETVGRLRGQAPVKPMLMNAREVSSGARS